MLINSETFHTTAMYLQISNTIPEEKLSGTARVSEFAVQQKERVKFTRFSKQCIVASRSLQSLYIGGIYNYYDIYMHISGSKR